MDKTNERPMFKELVLLRNLLELVLGTILRFALDLMCVLLKLEKAPGHPKMGCPAFSFSRLRKKDFVLMSLAFTFCILLLPNVSKSQVHQAELFLDCQSATCVAEEAAIRQALLDFQDQCQLTVNVLIVDQNTSLTAENGQLTTPDGNVWMDASVDYLLLLEPANVSIFVQNSGELVMLEDGPLLEAVEASFTNLLPLPNKNYCAIRAFLSALPCSSVVISELPCQVPAVEAEEDLTFLHLDVEELALVQETKRRLLSNHCAKVLIIKLPRLSPYYREYLENHELPGPLVGQLHSRYGREVTLILVIPDPQSTDYTLGVQHIRSGSPQDGECASQVNHILNWLPALEPKRLPEAMAELEAMLKGGEEYLNSQLADLQMIFHRSTQAHYGFDTLQYPQVHAENYGTLEGQADPPYYIPWQSIKMGTQEPVLARRKGGGFIPPQLAFTDLLGAEIPIIGGNSQEKVLGLSAPASTESSGPIYARMSGEDGPSVGQLNTVGYEEKLLHVVLVPVNGAHSSYSAIEIQNQLRSIYRQAVVEVSVTMHGGITVPGGERLENQESGFLSNYTPQMRQIIRAYKEVQAPQPNVYYLFLINDHVVGTKLGYMPRKKVYGFIINSHHFNLESYAKTIAHELGHGAYVLEHTYKTYEGQLSPGATKNLMDNGTGHDLHKYQWDLVHDPANVWSILDADEDREYIIVDNLEPFKDFRNDDGDGLFDSDDSFTFLAPSGLPITIPATASRVVFYSGDEVGGPMGLPSCEHFELMPFGTLRYFVVDSIHYNTYLTTSGDFDFATYADENNLEHLYIDTLTANLPNLSTHKAIIGFPCMEEGILLYKVGQVNFMDVMTPAEIASIESTANYRAAGNRRDYDFLAATNIQGESITIQASPDPAYLPEARVFLDKVGEAASCNSATALYAFVHAHQISFYPGFYEVCSETLAGLDVEEFYIRRTERIQEALIAAGFTGYMEEGEDWLSELEIATWKSYDQSVYRTYSEQMNTDVIEGYIENYAPPYTYEMAILLVSHFRIWLGQTCAFENLTWAQREKIIRILSVLDLTEASLFADWFILGVDQEQENLFTAILASTPEADYGRLLTLFEDGGNYDLYFNVINKLHDGADGNDPHGYQDFVFIMTKATLSARFRELVSSNLVYQEEHDYHCVNVSGQNCEQIISLHANLGIGTCVDDYYGEFTDDHYHRLHSIINSNECFIADNPYYASIRYDVKGRPFDYVPIYICEKMISDILPEPAHLVDGGAIYVLPYCFVDYLIRNHNSAQWDFQAAQVSFIFSLIAVPVALGESTALMVLTLGDVAISGTNLFVFAPANYEFQVSGDSYLPQEVLEQWKKFEMIWTAANITGGIALTAYGTTKISLSKTRQTYDYLEETAESSAELFLVSDELIETLSATSRLLEESVEHNPAIINYVKAQTAAIDFSRRTKFVGVGSEYTITINRENLDAYYKVVDQEVRIAGGGIMGDDNFFIIPDQWDLDLSDGVSKIADVNDMSFMDVRPSGYGNGDIVTGDLEVYYHPNHGFFFRLAGDLNALPPGLNRFRDLFLTIKTWNWDEFLGPFAEWAMSLPTAELDKLYLVMKDWPKEADGQALFTALKADMFTNALPNGLTNIQFRDFLKENTDRLIGWEVLKDGVYQNQLGPMEFFSNNQVLQSKYRLQNSAIPATHPDIPEEELTAIYHYTSGFDQNLNASLRAGDLALFDQAAAELIISALDKLPPFGGNALYRGVRGGEAVEAKLWNVGDEVEFLDFKSTSYDQNIANSFAIDNDGDVVYVISNGNAPEISTVSYFASESECLFPTNSRFRVTSIDENAEVLYQGQTHTITRIYLQFLPGPLDPNDLYSIFRIRFLDNGAAEAASHQLAQQTLEVFQAKGWAFPELTDELANVLVRADDQCDVILSRLAEWETEQLNVFLDDLAGENGAQLVEFFGEQVEGVRAWEVLSFSNDPEVSLLRVDVDKLEVLLGVESRVQLNELSSWDALESLFISPVQDIDRAALLEQFRQADLYFDNYNEFGFQILWDSESGHIFRTTGGDANTLGLDVREREVIGDNISLNWDEFDDLADQLCAPYVDAEMPVFPPLILGEDYVVTVGAYYPNWPGVLDVHVHGGGQNENFRIAIKYNDRAWWVKMTSLQFAEMIKELPQYDQVNAIRLFCCYGDGGGEEIARLLDKPVITSTDAIYVDTDNGRMRMPFGTLVRFVSQ